MKVPEEYKDIIVDGTLSTDGVRYTAFEDSSGRKVLGGGKEGVEEVMCRCDGTVQKLMACLVATRQYQPMVDGIENIDVRCIDTARKLIKDLCGAKIGCAEKGLYRRAKLALCATPSGRNSTGGKY